MTDTIRVRILVAVVLLFSCSAASYNRLPPSLDDEFNSLSLHHRPIGRDTWGLIAPRTPQGRGGPNWFEGNTRMWWTNPFNPKTPVQGLYTVSNGQLHLGLMPTPSAYQSWIDRSAGIHMPFVGALLYSVQKQLYGHFEIRASVDAVPGLTFQACLETGDVAFPFEIDVILYTNRDGSQHVKFGIATHNGWPSTIVDGIDITQMHTYAIEWTASKIAWYIDGIERWSQPSPGGNYDTYPALWYLLTGAAYGGADTDPNAAELPAYAHVDWVRNRPGNL
jgi:beta-glucanase (GH16 family)